jgi:uracil-DNA glycosylase
MHPPVITGPAVTSQVLLLGQAPGPREGALGRPFGWTAGKTMFRWFAGIGLDEAEFRARVYIAAVCRCFPGKNPRGGDRVPSPAEIATCAGWLAAEVELLRPRLLLPVGKLAIQQVLSAKTLDEVVGTCHRVTLAGRRMDAIPLPHPSGASTWHRSARGKPLLERALGLVAEHPAFRRLRPGGDPANRS